MIKCYESSTCQKLWDQREKARILTTSENRRTSKGCEGRKVDSRYCGNTEIAG